MRSLFFLLSVLAVSCSSGRDPTGDKAAVVCQVLDQVYHEGWKAVHQTRVFSDGTYEMTNTNPWHPAQAAQQFRGKVPEPILKALKLSASDPKVFQPQEGVPTYEVGIDDSKTRHPESVKALERFLRAQHLPE
jgi:hypothetical protein